MSNMSEFKDKNPECRKPHNIAGQNPRSVQVLHSCEIKPVSQSKDIVIEKVNCEETECSAKSSYIKSKYNIPIQKSEPKPSQIIIRKNEEQRAAEEAKKAEEEAKIKAEKEEKERIEREAREAEEAKKRAEQEERMKVLEAERKAKEEAERKAKEEAEKEAQEKRLAKLKAEDEALKARKPAFEPDAELDGLSFTQALRKKGYVNEMPTSTETPKPKEEVKEPVETKATPTKKIVKKTTLKINKDADTTGMSFTQSLRAQGYLGEEEEIEEVKEEEIEEPVETKTEITQKVAQKTTPKINTDVDTTGMSFTQSLRAQGYLGEEEEIEEVKEEEPVEFEIDSEKIEEIKEEVKEEIKEGAKNVVQKASEVIEKVEEIKTKSNGDVKTFIDLIRSEGLL